MTGQRHCVFLIPGDWDTPTGGYTYDRRLALALRDAGWTVDEVPTPPWHEALVMQIRLWMADMRHGSAKAVAAEGDPAVAKYLVGEIKKVINNTLVEKTGFAGVEDVYFTSIVVQ